MSNVSGVQQARDRVLQMARQIEDLAQSSLPPDLFFPEFLRLVVTSMGGRAGAIWLTQGNGRLVLSHDLRFSETGIPGNPQIASLNDRLLGDVMATGQAASFSPDDPATASKVPGNFLVIVAALQIGEDCTGVLQIFQRADAPREARPGFLQFVEQMAGHASRFLERRRTEPAADDSAKFLTDFEQFVLHLQRGENTEQVAATAANDGRQLLSCDRLSVAIHKGKKTSIVAISGQDRVNARANLTRAMASIAARVIALGEPVTFSGRVDHLPAQIEQPLAAFIQESGSRMVKLLPLIEPEPLLDSRGEENHRPTAKRPRAVIGCLVIEQTADSRPRPMLETQSEMLAEHVSAVLNHARRHDHILFLRLWQALGHGLEWFHGRRLAKTLAILGAVALVAVALCLVPWEYRVVGKGKLMPIRRQQIYAPENGHVVNIAVKGGDKVHKGQLLLLLANELLTAELNDNQSKLRQSQQQILSYNAEAEAAIKDGDHAAELKATGARAKAQQEVKGLTRVVEILRERVDSLQVKAPLDGTVAAFQLEQLLQGRPVQQGELLLEVMDETGPWQLELEVENNRMGHLLRAWNATPDHKLPVEFILVTEAEETYYGELEKLATRSAVSSDQSNIFEAFVSTDATKIHDRVIGAEVRAKISCGKRSLGYVLFGDVIEFIRQRLWL